MREGLKIMAPNSASRKTEDKNGFEPLFPMNFVQFQMRNFAAIARANNILTSTARAVWENEVELFKTETEQARNSITSLKSGADPCSTFANLFEQWHRNSESTIDHLRTINDLISDCEWRLLSLIADNMAPPKATE